MTRRWMTVAAAAAIACAVVAWLTCRRSATTATGPRRAAPSGDIATPAPRRVDMNQPRAESATGHRVRLAGHVVWPSGEPVPGARVWIERDPGASTVAGPDGAFTFDVAPGDYVLGARHEHTVSGAWPVAIGGDPTSTAPIRIVLRPAVTLHVSVLNPAQEPVAGAQVEVLGKSAQSTTDVRGEAVFDAVTPGDLEVRVTAAGYPVDVTSTQVDSFGATSHLTVRLRAGFSVTGQVIDVRGAGVAGAHVIACRSCPESDLAAANVGVTDAGGLFELKDVASGAQMVRVVDPGRRSGEPLMIEVSAPVSGLTLISSAPITVEGTTVDAAGAPVPGALVSTLDHRDETTTGTDGAFRIEVDDVPTIYLTASTATARGDLVVDRATAIRNKLRIVLGPAEATLAGRVVDHAQQPLAGLCVEIAPDAGVIGPSASTMTAADGGFAFGRLPAGDYRITVATAGCRHKLGEVYAGARDRAVVIQVSRTGAIAGSVVHEDGSHPHFSVSIANGNSAGAQLAGQTGAFRIDDLPPGVYELSISGPDFEDLRREVSIDAGTETDVGSLAVRSGRTLTGVVVDDHGTPVSGAKVLVDQPYDAGGIEDVRMATTDAAGRFAMHGIPARTSFLAAGAEDPRTACRSTRVPIADGTTDPSPLRLVIRLCGSISGTVSNAAGPIAGVMIGCGQPEVAMAITDARGRFTMPIVPPGEHPLTIYPPHGRPVMRDVRVEPGQRRELAIEL